MVRQLVKDPESGLRVCVYPVDSGPNALAAVERDCRGAGWTQETSQGANGLFQKRHSEGLKRAMGLRREERVQSTR